jgi:hypothetical protein
VRPGLARLLTRLYPRAWRERYGEEFEALLEDEAGAGLKAAVNVVWSALGERISPTFGGRMEKNPVSFGAMVRQPSAYVPIAMSFAALAIVLGHIALYGAAREADEGAAAHVWQLLMAAQLPVLAWFAVKWIRKAPRQALGVLALQAGAVLAAMTPVFWLGL